MEVRENSRTGVFDFLSRKVVSRRILMRGATSFGLNIDRRHMGARDGVVNANGGPRAGSRCATTSPPLYNHAVFANSQGRNLAASRLRSIQPVAS
jgi:hypothetical protein